MRLFMNISTICFLGLTMLAPNMALSHSSHGEPLNDGQAIMKASKDVEIIVKQSEPIEGRKIDPSWTKVMEKKIFKKGLRYFIVSFYHPEKQKTLYVLLNIYGEYLTANFNGNFKGL